MAKVRIVALPKADKGLNMSYGLGNRLQYNGVYHPDMMSEPNVSTRRTLGPVDRANANVEAEKSEVVVTNLNGDNIPEAYVIGGKKHSAGGTPLNLPEDSFIFSDTKNLRIKNPAILAMFNKPEGSFTPAEIAKKYDINKYRGFLGDPNTDKIQKDSSERMIANYNKKLAKLALVQESIKGFPQGIPKIAEPYLATSGVNPVEFLSPAMEQSNDIPQGKMGGALLYAQNGVSIFENPNVKKTYKPYVPVLEKEKQRAEVVNRQALEERMANQLDSEYAKRLQAIQYNKELEDYKRRQAESMNNLMQNQLDIEAAQATMIPNYGTGQFLQQFLPNIVAPVITKPAAKTTPKTSVAPKGVQVIYTDEEF